ncbi:MAG: DUF4430 domain-containing protein [Candidatus Kerfeldbacteria bacterium]|nr:DUF4430 domain-containing protein [Candidatus Kerfeldbacteria bacterium]
MKRFALFGAALVAILFLGAGCLTTTVTLKNNDNANSPAVFTIPLKITKSGDDTKEYRLTIESVTTALRLLENAAAENNFTIQTKTFDFGVLVEGIDGINADNSNFWSFYVNGVPATVGAGDYTLKDGDTVEFRYESLQAAVFRFAPGVV